MPISLRRRGELSGAAHMVLMPSLISDPWERGWISLPHRAQGLGIGWGRCALALARGSQTHTVAADILCGLVILLASVDLRNTSHVSLSPARRKGRNGRHRGQRQPNPDGVFGGRLSPDSAGAA